jgi:hypothetical protein
MPNQSTFYFAWVSSAETGFSGAHMREDELIFSFELKHEEGQFAELELEIANPLVGLLTRGLLWAWFSWSDGSGVYPLFFGRLVGIPDDLFAEIIKIKLVARPLNYAAQRKAVADGLKVLPFYDPIFIDDTKLDDPDTALEGYSALWHIDRLTHAVSVSDIINGEDGGIVFGEHEAFYDSLKMKVAGAPLLVCSIDADVSWTQCDNTGVFEMKSVPNLGDVISVNGIPTAGNSDATAGGSRGGGVKFGPDTPANEQGKSKDQEETQTTYKWTYKNVSPGPHADGDLMEESGSITKPFYGGELTKQTKVVQNADKETGQGEEYSIEESYKATEETQPPTPQAPSDTQGGGGGGGGGGAGQPTTPKVVPRDNDINNSTKEVAVEVEQDRVEAVFVAMRADVQPVLVAVTEDQDDLIEAIKMSARDIVAAGVATQSDGAYFATERGQQSIEYLLMICRAHLLAGSRIVEVEWDCPFPKLVYSGMSCRKNAYIADARLPNGSAFGKIVNYQLTGDGDSGELVGNVVINCSVGNAGSPLFALSSDVIGPLAAGDVLQVGTPVYVEEGYVEYGYQHYTGRMVSAATNDFSYAPLAFEAVGIQLPVTVDQILLRHEYYDGYGTGTVQEALATGAQQLRDFVIPPIGSMITSPPSEALAYALLEQQVDANIANAISDTQSYVELEFAPTRDISASASFTVDISQLSVPAQIILGE